MPPGASVLIAPPKYRPKTKVRRIHWDAVAPAKVSQSVWAKIEDTEVMEDLMNEYGLLKEIDIKFEIKEIARKSTAEVKPNAKVCLLDEKRAQNISSFA